MAKPNSRQTLIDYSLRALGAPVIEINVDEEQLEDRVDEALQFYQEYHSDSIVRNYRKHLVTNSSLTVADSSGFTEGLVITGGTSGAMAVIVSIPDSTTIRYNSVTVTGNEFVAETITSGSESTAVSVVTKGDVENGYVEVPDSMIFVNSIFPIQSSSSQSGMFSIEYQMHLNDLYNLRHPGVLIDYEMTKQYMAMVDLKINGMSQRSNFSRHQNRVYIEGDDLKEGIYIIVEGHETLDPDTYTDVYNDMLLKKYLTALIKRQWGLNLIKFEGMQLPGGVTLNGRQIYDDATQDIEKIEETMQLTYEKPTDFFVG